MGEIEACTWTLNRRTQRARERIMLWVQHEPYFGAKETHGVPGVDGGTATLAQAVHRWCYCMRSNILLGWEGAGIKNFLEDLRPAVERYEATGEPLPSTFPRELLDALEVVGWVRRSR